MPYTVAGGRASARGTGRKTPHLTRPPHSRALASNGSTGSARKALHLSPSSPTGTAHNSRLTGVGHVPSRRPRLCQKAMCPPASFIMQETRMQRVYVNSTTIIATPASPRTFSQQTPNSPRPEGNRRCTMHHILVLHASDASWRASFAPFV